MNTQNYILGLRSHDKTILRSIYKEFIPKVRRHVIRFGGTIEDAEDILQDALIVIYKKLEDDSFTIKVSFGAYLMGVCKFISRKKIQKKLENPVTFAEDEALIDIKANDIETTLVEQEKNELYEAYLGKLGELCQRLLEMIFTQVDTNQIATTLNLSNAHTVRNRKYRCLKELKKLIQKDAIYKELTSPRNRLR